MRSFKLSITLGTMALVVALVLLACFAPSRKPVLTISFSHYESYAGCAWAVLQVSNAGSGDAVYFSKIGPLPLGGPRCDVFVATSNGFWRNVLLHDDTGGYIRLRPGTSTNAWIMMPRTNCIWKASMEYRPESWVEGAPRFAQRWFWRLPGAHGEGTMSETVWSETFEYAAND